MAFCDASDSFVGKQSNRLFLAGLKDNFSGAVSKDYVKATVLTGRLSTCTPRSSVDIRTRQSPLQPVRISNSWEDFTFSRSKLSGANLVNSGDEMVLVDNLDKTGPVLESLSNRSANDILSTFASFLSQQQFMTSIIPWLQQVINTL
ncbi:tortifolia1-like protein 2 [Tanacetum coccineum]